MHCPYCVHPENLFTLANVPKKFFVKMPESDVYANECYALTKLNLAMTASLESKEYARPFLKWAGGKSRLLGQLSPLLPASLAEGNYLEPFVGGGAMFFYVAQFFKPKSCRIFDINPDLVTTWRVVRDNVDALIQHLSVHQQRHSGQDISDEARKAYYYSIREIEPEDDVSRAARFIYLNKTCFNGLHRMNSKGKFNVPMGKYKNPKILDAENLVKVSRLLENVEIELDSFLGCEKFIKQGDFVYFDPPYEPISTTSSFTAYAKDGFSQQEQIALRDLAQRIGCKANVMLSNSTAPFIQNIYSSKPFYQHKVNASRAINSKSDGRGKIEELLITTYLPPSNNDSIAGIPPYLQGAV